jgi:hypothetical protein
MAAGTRVVWFPGGSRRLVHEPQAVAVLGQAAKHVTGAIDDAIPVVTGSYKAHFDLGLDVQLDLGGAAARITITEPRWHIIEHGSVKNPPYAPIRRGVDAAGLRWERR